jgi:transporter family-2 protein
VSGGTAAAATLALVAGLAGSIQVAVMGRFGERIGSYEAIAANLLFSTLIATTILLLLRQSLAGFGEALHSPWWYWVGGGGMGVVVVFTITVVTPQIGATATIGLLIAGQLAMGVLIDRYGWFGVEQVPLNWPRIVGVLLLAVGALLALRKG